MPEGAVCVGRPTRWGNPFRLNRDGSNRDACIRQFEQCLTNPAAGADGPMEWIREHVHELRGKDLACWCPLDKPCHADVLLRVANA